MKNKLPEAGKRYRNKITGTTYKAFKHKTKQDFYFMESQSNLVDLVVDVNNFWVEFEEIPEDEDITQIQDLKKKKSIWKSLVGLNKNQTIPQGFVKNKEGNICIATIPMSVEKWENIITEYCPIKDFLDDYKKLKKRVEELEKLIN